MSPAQVIPLHRDEEPYQDAPPEVVAALNGTVPTGQQWKAISHPLTPIAVVAGAGSGKTSVMAARVTFLALVAAGRLPADHPGVMPSQVLCLTFTNKAAEELARRVRKAVEGLGLPEGEEPTVLTYHAFAAHLVDQHGLRMGLEPGRTLLSEAQRWQLVGSLLDECEFEHLEVRTDHVVGRALALADQVANHLADPQEVRRRSLELAAEMRPRNADEEAERTTMLKRAELCTLVEAYRRRKREIGAMDYGDQIAQAFELVREHPEVAEEFRARYAAVLLDEYQDTNVAQARLLGELCGRGYPVFAVGDPDQNIYAWRGASLKNILRFHEDFGEEDAEAPSLPLYVNFRSGSRILDVADVVIGKVPEERRPADKRLRPDPSRGEGRVEAFTASDALHEGREIAAIIQEERERSGLRYDDVAILCRKSRLFDPITLALREAGIPFEVVDLGGLLKLPEVVDVVSWLRLLDDPGRNIALARMLMGPRWRVGYRDLVALARWSSVHNRELAASLPDEDDMPGDVVFALVEALDHLDDPDMENLSADARSRLGEFRGLLEEIREQAKGSLGDLVGEIVERTGLMRELEASANPSAVGGRRNLLNLIQHVSSFSPVEGESSLSTLIEYMDTAEDTRDEIEPAQPSGDDTVKLLTIHKAKGLEWPVVFVPGLSEHTRWPNSAIFPDTSRQPNPLKQADTLPFEFRGDADVLPAYEGDLKELRRQLRLRGEEEERRLCYVALTRAKDLLVVSASHRYEGPEEPHRPGKFFDEIASSASSELRSKADPPTEDPFVELRRLRAAEWPPRARPDDADELFPEGWHRAAADAAEDPATQEWRLLQLRPDEEVAYRDRLSKDLERAALIKERTGGAPPLPTPTSLSVSGVIDYLKCPKLFFWSQVRSLPRRPSKAARLGSEVHRWIELQGRGQATLLDLDALPDLSTEERLAEPPKVEQLKEAFRQSRFADVVPLYTERPFILYLDGMVVGGRIDAVFGEPDGRWEVVDYKTGRVPAEDDPLLGLQLDLYALACAEVWGKKPEDLKLTYFYLAEGVERTRAAGDPEETRARVKAALAGIAAEQFDASPGFQCKWCDFLSFCAPGQEYMERANRG